jgi:16S rRNA (guanine966-N2)-methyltransferase
MGFLLDAIRVGNAYTSMIHWFFSTVKRGFAWSVDLPIVGRWSIVVPADGTWGGGGMRVIAGKAKGHRLRSVPGKGTRPITDRAKSALFSILGNDVIGCRFLDLFAGTGQVGIEALSRGAAEAVFVERDGAALRTIRANLAHTRLEAGARVVRGDVFGFLARAADAAEGFDYVYIAPPQYRGLWTRTLGVLDDSPGWLVEDGWVVVQMHPREYEEQMLKHMVLFDQRTYGGVMLCFYAKEELAQSQER